MPVRGTFSRRCLGSQALAVCIGVAAPGLPPVTARAGHARHPAVPLAPATANHRGPGGHGRLADHDGRPASGATARGPARAGAPRRRRGQPPPRRTLPHRAPSHATAPRRIVPDAILHQRRPKWITRIVDSSLFAHSFFSPRTSLPRYIAEKGGNIPAGSSREDASFGASCARRLEKKGSDRWVERTKRFSASTAVLPKIPHSNSCKRVRNRPLRPCRGRFGTLLQQLECGIFGRTALSARNITDQVDRSGSSSHQVVAVCERAHFLAAASAHRAALAIVSQPTGKTTVPPSAPSRSNLRSRSVLPTCPASSLAKQWLKMKRAYEKPRPILSRMSLPPPPPLSPSPPPLPPSPPPPPTLPALS